MMPTKHSLARQNMITNQLLVSEVSDPALLSALSNIKREQFIPEQLRDVAYTDDDVELFHDRYLMEPLVFARLAQYADIRKDTKILIIGAATGYSAAVIESISNHVVAIESQRELADIARKNLRKIKSSVEVFTSALTVGYAMLAPYDVIFIEGAVSHIPNALYDQLNDGGRIVTVVNKQTRLDSAFGLGCATLFTKRGDSTFSKSLFECSTGVLSEFTGKQEFRF